MPCATGLSQLTIHECANTSCQWQPSFGPCRHGGAAPSGVPLINTCYLLTTFRQRDSSEWEARVAVQKSTSQRPFLQRGVSSSKQSFGFTLSTSGGGFAALILCMRTVSSSSSSSSGSLEPLLNAPADGRPYQLLFMKVSLAYNF